MNDLADRIRAKRKELGMTQDKVAEMARKLDPELDVNRVTISHIENGLQRSMRDRLLLSLSKVLKCSPNWLVYGVESRSDQLCVKEPRRRYGLSLVNIEPVEMENRMCPVISWVQAGAFTEVIDHITPDEYDYYPCPTRCGPSTYILKVRGDSMLNRFEDGDLIYVDPDQIEPIHNKFVIAMLDDASDATFKQLQIIDGQKYLQAINPTYPPDMRFLKINGNCRIVGTVIAHVKPI